LMEPMRSRRTGTARRAWMAGHSMGRPPQRTG
jgi:hypothetical protein